VAHLKTYLMPFKGNLINLFQIDFTKYQEEACSDNTGIPSSYNDTIFQDEDRTSVPISPDTIWSEMSKHPIGEMATDAGVWGV
jgi:hypothetical protein